MHLLFVAVHHGSAAVFLELSRRDADALAEGTDEVAFIDKAAVECHRGDAFAHRQHPHRVGDPRVDDELTERTVHHILEIRIIGKRQQRQVKRCFRYV